MSKEIDQRVVEMRFDNKHFEENVRTSMSTLERLKQGLNLSGATKGLNDVNAAAKKLTFDGINKGIDTVKVKFSAMQIAGVTALTNITNQAVNAGKKMVSALTIDPIKTGFSEYELKMDSVKTILASTGEPLEKVNNLLEELNAYSDQTIYSFADMTQNIGKFTNAGVKLDDAVLAIKGISNEAALSGASAEEASRAMYNFAQALSAGSVKLIDWKSIENANMATVGFKEELMKTAVELGTVKKQGDKFVTTTTDLNGKVSEAFTSTTGFNDSLAHQWMTTDVLVKTLSRYADSNTEIGKKAFAAAQDVTKLTQVFDILKETAQSGWSKTWELIFGDIEQAKAIFTPLTNFLSGIIDSISDARNNLLEGALSSPFKGLVDKIDKVTTATEKVKKVTEDYSKIVQKVMNGEYGTGDARFKKLAEEGYDWAKVQNIINEKLGSSVRHTEQLKESQEDLSESTQVRVEDLLKLSRAELLNLGFTYDEINALRDLERQSKKTGIPIDDLVKDIDQLSGRSLLMNSFKNVGKSLVKVFMSLKEAYRDAFPPMQSETLYNVIAALHNFSTKLIMNDETAKNLTRTLKGVFAIIDIIVSFVGGAAKFAFQVLSQVLGMFNTDFLGVTAVIGDALVAFRNAIDFSTLFAEAIAKAIPYIIDFGLTIKEFVQSVMEMERVQKAIEKVKEAFANFGDIDLKDAIVDFGSWIKYIIKNFDKVDFKQVGKNIVDGLVLGIKEGVIPAAKAILELGKAILDSICEQLGIHSPSTEFFEIGENIIQGLLDGLQNGVSKVWNFLKDMGAKCVEVVSNINWGALFAGGLSIGMVTSTYHISTALKAFAAPFEGVGELAESAGKSIERISKGLKTAMKGYAFEKRTEGIKNLAIAIAILAGSLIVLTMIDTDKLWDATKVLGVLVGMMAGLIILIEGISIAANKLGAATKDGEKSAGGISMGKLALALLGISASLLIMASVVKKIAKLDPDQAKQGFLGLAGMIVAIGVIFAACGTFVRGAAASNIAKFGLMLLGMAVALKIMVSVVRMISWMSPEKFRKGMAGVYEFMGVITFLILLSQLSTADADKIGIMMGGIATAMISMVMVVKRLGKMKPAKLAQGMAALYMLVGAVGILIKIAGSTKEIAAAGKTLLAMSGAMLIMTVVVATMSVLSPGAIAKGLVSIAAFGGVMYLLLSIVSKFEHDAPKLAGTLLAMSAAIGILAGVAVLLSFIPVKGLAKGIAAVGLLSAFVGGMIYAMRGVQDIKGNLIIMTVAIGLLVAAVVGLSFIDPAKLATATAAISSILLSFTAMVGVTKFAKSTKSMRKTLIFMLGIIAILGAIVVALSFIDAGSALQASMSIGVLLASMTGSILLLGHAGKISKTVSKQLGPMLAVVAGMAAIIAALSFVDTTNAVTSATAISMLMMAFSGSLILLGTAGRISTTVAKQMGPMLAVTAGLAAILGALSLMNAEASIPSAIALGVLLNAMSSAMVILGFVNKNAAANVGALAVLGLVVGELAVIFAIMQKFNVQPSIDVAISLSTMLLAMSGALAILAVVGLGGPAALIGIGSLAVLIAAIGGLIVGIGALNDKYPQLQTFLDTGIPMLEKIGYALGSFFGNIVGGFTAGATAGLPAVGTNLSTFMTNLQPFIDGAKTIDETMMGGVKALAQSVMILTGASLLDGIAKFVTGSSSISTFGSELSGLGTHLNAFATNLGPFDETKVTTVTCAANAIKAMAEAAQSLPKEGGWVQKICGEGSLADFGSELPALATNLKSFATNLGTFDNATVSTVTCAANAIKAMAEAASGIDGQAEWSKKLFGDNGLAAFGDEMAAVGTKLKEFVKNLGTFSEGQVATVKSAVSAIKAMAGLADADLAGAKVNLPGFGNVLPDFGSDIKEFISGLPASDAVSTAVANIKQLTTMANDIANANIAKAKEFASGLGDMGDAGVDKFVTAFTSESAKADVKAAAGDLMMQAVDGAESKEESFKSAAETVAKAGASAVKSESIYTSFYNAGSYLVTGFAAGISDNDYKVEAKARAMANAAKEAAEEALGIESPSKVFFGIGSFAGMGFVNALVKYSSIAYSTSSEMGESAKSGLGDAIAKIKRLLDGDIDIQPTIRPVVDLSGVATGVDAINKMMPVGGSIGVSANVNAIKAMTSNRGQNGDNSGVINAINKLRSDLGKVGNTTNIIEGITYDDGSNVNEAIKQLVHAAKVNRRV